jgi:hypothetical protein
LRRIEDEFHLSLNVEGRIDDFDFRIVKIEGEKEDVLKGIT